MIITVTNEFFISYFFDPSFVVEYQIYIKIFSIAGTFVSLALIPVWSAVTKAFVEKRYDWIIKLVRFLYFVAGIAVLFQLAIIPFLDPILEFWLGYRGEFVRCIAVCPIGVCDDLGIGFDECR